MNSLDRWTPPAELTMVVRETGSRRAPHRIPDQPRGHPFVMDADALHSEGDELSVEERPLQKPALVFDPLAREAGELGLRTTVSTGLADFGQDLARDPFSEAFRFRLSARENCIPYRPDSLTVSICCCPPGVQTSAFPRWSSSSRLTVMLGSSRSRISLTSLATNHGSPSFTTVRTELSSNRNSVGKPATLSASP